MNVRHRLLTSLIQDEPQPLWPEGSGRQISYTIATSSVFNFIMYCAIILNSLLVVTEISTHSYRNLSITMAFQLGHLMFYFLLLLELAIKIAGFSFDIYLNSKWNQIELMVFILATFDEFLLAMGFILLVEMEELLVSASWLRTVRLLRLLKLSSILAPRIVLAFDSHMDNIMLTTFEIGKVSAIDIKFLKNGQLNFDCNYCYSISCFVVVFKIY